MKGLIMIPQQKDWFKQQWIMDIKKNSIAYVDIEPFEYKKFTVTIFYFNFQ